MNRSEKVELVEEIQRNFKKAGATFIADYQGIKAVEMNDFRKSLRDASIDFVVVRN
ncbi:MAG: 50S ribosomal protein L10, partial [Deltaproteobacteria bacterium]|nr:50S ribosomal protein L10 [Deltaproteobacteria bacterium]